MRKTVLFLVLVAFLVPGWAQTGGHGPVLLQVTIGATATAFTTQATPAFEIIVQNNAAHNIRVGDSTVTSSKGALLSGGTAPGGSMTLGPFTTSRLDASKFFVAGTQNDVVDVVLFQ